LHVGHLDFLLIPMGYSRANGLSRPFDGFCGNLQAGQHLHRLAGGRKRHLGTHHCFHASDTGRRLQTGNTQFVIRWVLSFGAM
jgi:hypothetical protein